MSDTKKMKISNEAVEAAARQIDFGRGTKSIAYIARKALEAAAPFIMAQAWDESAEAHRDVAANDYGPWPENPYQKPRT